MKNERQIWSMFLLLALSLLCYGFALWLVQQDVQVLHARLDLIDMRPVAQILRAPSDEAAEAAARGTT